MSMPTTLENIASGLKKVKWCGDSRFVACCPAHDDRSPSFAAKDDNGKILVKCFAGCTQDEVINALRNLGLWHTASLHQLDRRKRSELKKDIHHHQRMLLLSVAQTTELSDEDRTQMKESIAFLKEHAHG